MKQGTRLHLPVLIKDDNFDKISKIEFIFKQFNQKRSQALKSCTYPDECELNATEARTVDIPWTKEETYLFKSGEAFYMDTRITYEDTDDNPQTNIVELIMDPTLFGEGE